MLKNKLLKISLATTLALALPLVTHNNYSIFNSFAMAQKINPLDKVIQDLKKKLASDDRVTIFDVKIVHDVPKAQKNIAGSPNLTIARGKVLEQEQKEELLKALRAVDKNIQDEIQVFPYAQIGELSYGIVNLPVMQIRDNPKHSAQLITQAIMGTTLRVIGKNDKKTDWIQICMDEDKYVGWAKKVDISFVNKASYDKYRATDKLLITDLSTPLLKAEDKSSKADEKLFMTSRVTLLSEGKDFFKVKMPIGNKHYSDREYFISKDAARAIGKDLVQNKDINKEIVVKAKSMISSPYLWGGSSPAMMDCSGLTQMLYKANGYVIPRDADQQQEFTKPVKSRDELQTGDLVFFADSGKSATHVGMYIGDKKFIHSSVGYGGVAITSFDPKDPLYNPLYIKTYIGAGRVLK